jgi:Ca2+-binding RTX toxin-like protein
MKRTMILVAMLGAVLVLSAPMAEARKKHHALHTVHCPNQTYDNYTCKGTAGKDRLVGGPADRSPYGAHDQMYGKEGDDVYEGGNGRDIFTDESATSNDRYVLPSTEFSFDSNSSFPYTWIKDWGGNADVLDLSSYRYDNFDRRNWLGKDLYLEGDGARDILIDGFFTSNTIETFKFSDRTVTAAEIKKEFSGG